MALIETRYGKARVRVMRVTASGPRELDVKVMLQGRFGRAYTAADNTDVIATDSLKNLVYVVAGHALDQDAESFCAALADKLLDLYPHVDRVEIDTAETRWLPAGAAQAYVLDGNGKATVRLHAGRDARQLWSGLDGFTMMKTGGSGFAGFLRDGYTSLPDVTDRICATSMDARWLWQGGPASFTAANATLLHTMQDVFLSTYSHSVQDSMYRMAEAALAAMPGVAEIALACPNLHYIPVTPPGARAGAAPVFMPTAAPHGQIECRVARG